MESIAIRAVAVGATLLCAACGDESVRAGGERGPERNAAVGEAGVAPAVESPPGVAVLFRDTGSGLGADDQLAIFEALALSPDPSDPGRLLEGACGGPVESAVEVRDLNGDGVPEVIVELASTCLYGGTGTGTTLFVRDPSGTFRPNLGFPGMIAEELPNRRQGFPDLLIAGMSDCFAVWGWDGSAYEHVRNEPQRPGACDFLPQ